MNILDKGLGRIIVHNPHDKEFLMKSILSPTLSERTSRYWNASGWWGDQSSTSECVGYSWAHWVEDGPVTQKGVAPIILPNTIYTEAQKIDEWQGENYDGTSVRAGAKVLQDKGFIESYLWAWDVQTIIQALLEKGPVVVGTAWYYDMFFPNKDTNIITFSGNMMGGHAYLLNGVNVNKKLLRIKNSWGREWGNKGHAYISFDDMDKLIRDQGEACLALEIKK